MKVITRQLPVFIGFALSVLLFTHCVSGEAQQPKKVSLVGILTPDPLSARANLFEAFRIGLRERGYVEGQNIACRCIRNFSFHYFPGIVITEDQ